MAKRKTIKVWIDTDPTFGDPNGDCDDGYCIIALEHAKNIEIVGTSPVFGNTTTANAYAKLRDLKDMFYPNLPIAIGAEDVLALNNHKKEASFIKTETSPAVEAMATALTDLKNGQKMTIAAIGSLVNVATLLIMHPELTDKIESVVVVAGRYDHTQQFKFGTNPGGIFRDLNFDVDPAAFYVLLNAPVKTVLAGVEVSQTMWIYKSDLDLFKKKGSTDIQYMAEQSADWLALWESFGNEINHPKIPIHGFHPFDLFAGGFIINPDWFKGEYRMASTPVFPDDTLPDETNVYKPYLVAPPETCMKTPRSKKKEEKLAKTPGVVYYLESVTSDYKKDMIKLLLKSQK
ncbi:MAG: hypothetical protein HEP71_30720 [Roseivirga sp.]|nr:hypothetical protein [Roseivirga sp.]